jgi:hypothetical protein
MKTKFRPFLGITLLSFSFFLAFGTTTGIVGELLAKFTTWLFGQTGCTAVALSAFTFGLLCIVPLQLWIRFFRWTFTSEQGKAAREEHPIVHAPHAKVIPIRTMEPVTVKDARGGLKYLGYTNGEIEPVLARVGSNGTADEIIRASLKLLRKAA